MKRVHQAVFSRVRTMKNKLGEDPEVYEICKNVNIAKKNKYWKKGYKAAKKHLNRTDNPYKLSSEIIKLLKKRTFWDMGFEEKAFAPSKELKRKREETEVRDKERKKREERERKEKAEKAKKHKHKHKHNHNHRG